MPTYPLHDTRVMTIDQGVLSGDLDVCLTDLGDGVTEVLVGHCGDDFYEATGSPVDGLSHDDILARLRDCGTTTVTTPSPTTTV